MNGAKSKIMRSARDGNVGEMNMMMDGQVLEEVEVFKYLGSLVPAVGRVEAEVQQRVLEGSNVMGAVRCVVKSRTMSCGVKKISHLQILVHTGLRSFAPWGLFL